jgi:hypothetical protein
MVGQLEEPQDSILAPKWKELAVSDAPRHRRFGAQRAVQRLPLELTTLDVLRHLRFGLRRVDRKAPLGPPKNLDRHLSFEKRFQCNAGKHKMRPSLMQN